MDGGSRIVRFQMKGQDAILFMPARPGLSDFPEFGSDPLVRISGRDTKVTYSSVFPLQKETVRRLIDLYPPKEQAEFAATQKFPTFDPYSKCGFLVSKLKSLFKR